MSGTKNQQSILERKKCNYSISSQIRKKCNNVTLNLFQIHNLSSLKHDSFLLIGMVQRILTSLQVLPHKDDTKPLFESRSTFLPRTGLAKYDASPASSVPAAYFPLPYFMRLPSVESSLLSFWWLNTGETRWNSTPWQLGTSSATP